MTEIVKIEKSENFSKSRWLLEAQFAGSCAFGGRIENRKSAGGKKGEMEAYR
jgi:hypothetical protein